MKFIPMSTDGECLMVAETFHEQSGEKLQAVLMPISEQYGNKK